MALCAAALALPAALFGLRYQALRQKKRQTGSLTEEENVRLAAAMRDILQDAISKRGTTFRDYVDGNNRRGSYQEHLQVFQKAGQQCPRCGATIERIRVAGRSSCFCPQCQQPE